jgi:hypothetical protein
MWDSALGREEIDCQCNFIRCSECIATIFHNSEGVALAAYWRGNNFRKTLYMASTWPCQLPPAMPFQRVVNVCNRKDRRQYGVARLGPIVDVSHPRLFLVFLMQ